jgi:hypothetical protein
MPHRKPQPPGADGPSLANASLNSSRRSGTQENGTGNPARDPKERDSTESTKVPDQQRPKA